MTKNEFLQKTIDNAMIMLQAAEEREDKELALVAHATLTAVAAVQNGDAGELAAMLRMFIEFAVAKEEFTRKQAEEGDMPESMADLLKSAGIGFSPN